MKTVFLLLACSLAGAAGGGTPGLSSPARLAADAAAAKDEEALAALAAAAEDDVFATVDELRAAGLADVALALADAAGKAGLPGIAAFARRPFADDAAARAALQAAERAAAEGRHEAALAALRRTHPRAGTLATVEVPRLSGRLLLALGREGEADAEYSRAAEAAKALGRDLDGEVEFLRVRFGPLLDQYRLPELERLVRRLTDLHRMRGDVVGTANTEADLGATYTALRLPGRAIPLLNGARARLGEAYQAAKDEESAYSIRWSCAFVDLMILRVLDDVGNYSLALAYGERAVKEFRYLEDPLHAALALGDIGTVYLEIGAHEEALRLFEAALEGVPVDEPGCALDRSMLLGNIGHTHLLLGNFAESARYFGEALAVPGVVWSEHNRAIALLNLGEIRLLEGDADGALGLFRDARRLSSADRIIEAWSLVSVGDALAMRGASRDARRLAEARQAYDEAAGLLAEVPEPKLRMLLHTSLAELLLAQGRPGEAIAESRRGLDLLDRLTGGLADGEATSTRGTRDRCRLFRCGVRAAVAAGDLQAVFEMIERGRAQAFIASLGGRVALLQALLEPEQVAALEEASAREAAAYQRLRSALPDGRLEDLRALTRELEDCQREHAAALQRVERASRLVAGASRPARIPLSDACQSLGPDTAMVLYSVDSPESVALLLTRDGARCVRLPGEEEIAALCAEVDLSSREQSPEEALGRIDAAARVLVATLGLPGTVRLLLVSPDGPLSGLPWPLLVESAVAPDAGAALVPSAATWLLLRGQAARTGRGRVALGDPVYSPDRADSALHVFAGARPLAPLPATAEEVRAVTGAGDVRLLGADATEAGLARALSRRERWSAVHLACHGLLNARNPALSALALTPTETGDGFLTAMEVYAQSVDADLVVLSACDTGADPARAGEGLAGLTRAFLLAGAPRVVASVGKVDDEAARAFMRAFYEEWAKAGVSTDEALRRARARVRAERPHPSAWGGFVLWGLPQ